ncbi:DNA repair protein RadC [Bradyrhizobium embrapense]
MPAKPDASHDEADETPHYHGHRERLRERFYAAGPDALTDYELLEMALFAAIPRRDTKPLAKALLKKFGSFAEVVHAPVARLREVEGVKDASINQIKLLAAAAGRIAKGEIKRNIALSSWNDVIAYCRTGMVSRDNIVFTFRGQKVDSSREYHPSLHPKLFAFSSVLSGQVQFFDQIVST